MNKLMTTLLVCLSLAACTSPTPNFYQPLTLTAAQTTYPNFKKTVLLKKVVLPAENARPQITTLGKEDFELKIDEFNRWGAAPDNLLQRALNTNLSRQLPNATIENQTPLRKNYQYAVTVEVTQMTGKLKESAVLSASYYIANQQGKILKSGKFSQQSAIKGEYEAYIPALSQLFVNLSSEIATTLNAM
jgi:uncharacterized lipoprotein YmbA